MRELVVHGHYPTLASMISITLRHPSRLAYRFAQSGLLFRLRLQLIDHWIVVIEVGAASARGFRQIT